MKRLFVFLIISALVFFSFVSCNSDEVDKLDSKGYLSVSVPPIKGNTKGITNAEAASEVDDYLLYVLFPNDTKTVFQYSKRNNSFDNIPLDVGTYQLIVVATNTVSTHLYSYNQFVGIAYTDNVVIEEHQFTDVDMTLHALDISYEWAEGEKYANSIESVKVTINRPEELLDNSIIRISTEIYAIDESSEETSLTAGYKSLVLERGETEKDVEFTLPVDAGTYTIRFNYDLDVDYADSTEQTRKTVGITGSTPILYMTGWDGTGKSEKVNSIYETTVTTTIPDHGVSATVQWAED